MSDLSMKKFFTYEQQLQHLKNKGLIIADEEQAVKFLKKYSYYASISAYKDVFKKERNGNYIKGTELSHIITLYLLDRYLRDTVLHQIMIVERHIKSLYSYEFCSLFGDRQQDYLNANNYNYTQYQHQVNEYLVMVQEQIRKPQKEYVSYNLKRYGEVPFWVLIHVLTFGNISKMYGFSSQKLQSQIARQFGADVYSNKLLSMLQVLSKFRNVCAHGERLYSFHSRMEIEDMPLHSRLGILKKNSEYVQGKRDLFAVIICLKYLLDTEEFRLFVLELDNLMNVFFNKLSTDIVDKIKRKMGFPENWKDSCSL